MDEFLNSCGFFAARRQNCADLARRALRDDDLVAKQPGLFLISGDVNAFLHHGDVDADSQQRQQPLGPRAEVLQRLRQPSAPIVVGEGVARHRGHFVVEERCVAVLAHHPWRLGIDNALCAILGIWLVRHTALVQEQEVTCVGVLDRGRHDLVMCCIALFDVRPPFEVHLHTQEVAEAELLRRTQAQSTTPAVLVGIGGVPLLFVFLLSSVIWNEWKV